MCVNSPMQQKTDVNNERYGMKQWMKVTDMDTDKYNSGKSAEANI